MFHQLVISHEGLLCDEINKNIQKIKKDYNMTVVEALMFVKKEFPQFSNICNSFGPHFEDAEAKFKQTNFLKTEPEPKYQKMMNHTLLFLMVLLFISKMIRSISSVDKTRKDIVHDFRMESQALVALQSDPVNAIDSLEEMIDVLEERIKDEFPMDLDSLNDDIDEEQGYLHTLPPRPDTTKITNLHSDKEETEEELKQATQRLEKLKKKLENLKRIKTTERQAKADAKSGNREANKQQRHSTKQQQKKTGPWPSAPPKKKKRMADIKEAEDRIGLSSDKYRRYT
jgi:DNA repair exonuclease SbcCD ATPase subunit